MSLSETVKQQLLKKSRAGIDRGYRAEERSCIERRIVFSSTSRSVTNLCRILEINV
jgi:hypothetical protein